MTRREELDQLWANPAHWTPAGLYRCAADPRLMVLKRVGAGYTINVAHHRAWFLLAGLLAVSMAPLVIHLVLGRRAPGWLLLATLLTPITVVVVTLVWLSRRDN
jgi:hypothetical protein